MLNRTIKPTGKLNVRVIKAEIKASFRERMKTVMRVDYILGYLANHAARFLSKMTGIPTVIAELSIVHILQDGTKINHGVVSYRIVTDAFVQFLVDQMQAETSEWGDFKYHDSGVGTTAAAAGDTDIETTDGESRAIGTQTEGDSVNIYKSIGTIDYTSTKAITEHGLFSKSTGTTLLDRSVFAAKNVINGESITFTYAVTFPSGS